MTQITLPASFDNLAFNKDGSTRLKFESRELTSEEIHMLLGFRNSEGWIQYSQSNEFKAPPNEAPNLDLKSPSELQKDALYVWYKDEPRTETFNSFYNTQMERIRQGILSKVKK